MRPSHHHGKRRHSRSSGAAAIALARAAPAELGPALHGLALGLGLAVLVLAMTISVELVGAAWQLDAGPLREVLVALAQAWHDAMTWLGIPQALHTLREAALALME